jgi:hypothetical protein
VIFSILFLSTSGIRDMKNTVIGKGGQQISSNLLTGVALVQTQVASPDAEVI